eukprot:5711237-Amphidinium_carterae.1
MPRQSRQQRGGDSPLPSDPEMRRLVQCIAAVLGDSAADSAGYALHAMDSLRLALLTARLKAEFQTSSLTAAR